MELKELTIKELLSDNILVIPEIQREYVWGSNKEVLSKFLSELNSSLGEISAKKLQEIKPIFNDEDTAPDMREKLNSSLQKVNNYYETNIGFLYSYDAGNNEHFIIDGQQRLTTIVLLAYYYAVKDERVSDFKTLLKTETPLMHFSYRVRPLTEQFLQNLFTGVSLDILKNLKDAKWYVSDYDNDKTIESICNLYKFICDEKNSFCNLNYDSLLQRVKFYYFDVQQTSQGEELYITMNSRGEQLKDSEQIKPYILESIKDRDERLKDAQEWDDDWEEYFYEKLKAINEDEVSKIDVAMDNIIKITLELYGKIIGAETEEKRKFEFDEIKAAEDCERIDFSKISMVVKNIKLLLDSTNKEIQKLDFVTFLFSKKRDEKSLYLFESLIKAKELNFDEENIHRLIRLVNNSWSYGIIKHVPLLKFLSEMEKTGNIYQYINSHRNIIDGVFVNQNNNEEMYKIQAILENKISETEVETAEALSVFSGKIHLLYRNSSEEVSWEQFKEKMSKAKEIFTTSDKAYPIQEDKFVDFVYSFIKSFDNWRLLANQFLFQNNNSYWNFYLTNYTYRVPLNNVLLDKQDVVEMKLDDNTSPVYSFLLDKNNLKHIIDEDQKRSVVWDNNYGWILWRQYAHNGYKDAIIFKGMKNRNTYLSKLLDDKSIALADDNVRIGNFFKDLDVRFKVNEKEFVWMYQNEIKLAEKDEVIFDSDFLSEYTEWKLEEIKNKLSNYNN